MERIQLSRQPTGGIVPLPEAQGALMVWERPRVKCRYLLSVRGGGKAKIVAGRTARERSVLMVLRAAYVPAEDETKTVPMRLVCRLTPPALLDATPFAELIALTADWYGDALTFVEVKDGPVLARECQRLGVAVQIQERLDLATSAWKKDLGWLTDEETGPATLNALMNAVRATGDGGPGAIDLACAHAIAEIETFSADAEAPCVSFHDDVLALAVGIYNIGSASLLHPDAPRRMVVNDGWKVVESFRG